MAFEPLFERELASIQAHLMAFRETRTGLRHFHVRRDDRERGFLIALPTRPKDSTGAPHVLEHLSLCASRRFPVRAPFFGMLQRSMASFMNAFTTTDMTFYPFATPDPGDYANLMDLYTHAVFHPSLDRLDFLQEGWRPVLDARDRLGFDGVVFNEMKGALASPGAWFEQGVLAALSPGTSRIHQAGGDPLAIPHLTHEALLRFHAEHYHPGRAVVFSYGSFEPDEIHKRLDAWIGSDPWPALPPLPAEPSQLKSPLRTSVSLPVQANDAGEHRLRHAWILDVPSTADRLEAEIMAELLVGDGSALGEAIETLGFGRRGKCGLSAEGPDAVFCLSVDGLTPEQLRAVELMWGNALVQASAAEIPLGRREAVLRAVELQHRRVSASGGMPYGLNLICEAAGAVLYDRDPAEALDPSVALEEAGQRVREPGAVARWVQRHLLNNPRKVAATGIPDPGFFARRATELETLRTQREAALTEAERIAIRRDMTDLKTRQTASEPPDVLPTIRPCELDPAAPRDPPVFTSKAERETPARIWVPAATNGVQHLSVALDLNEVRDEQRAWVDLVLNFAFDVGVQGRSWEDTARWRAERGQAFQGRFHAAAPVGQPEDLGVQAHLGCVALTRDVTQAAEVLATTLQTARFDDRDRMRYLFQGVADRIQQGMGQFGNTLARLRGMAHLHANGAFQEDTDGLPAVRTLMAARAALDGGGRRADAVLEQLSAAWRLVQAAPLQIQACGDAAEQASERLSERLMGHRSHSDVRMATRHRPHWATPARAVLVAPTAVSYVWQTHPGPPAGHPDAAVAEVLVRCLTQAVLHPAIRERGGAYGGRAQVLPGALALHSHRDPRLSGTLGDFEKAVDHACSTRFPQQTVDEAILATVRDTDPPRTPEAAAMTALRRQSLGVSDTHRQRFRQTALGTTPEDVRRVAATWLGAPSVSQTVFTGPERQQEAEECGLTAVDLTDLKPAPTRRLSP